MKKRTSAHKYKEPDAGSHLVKADVYRSGINSLATPSRTKLTPRVLRPWRRGQGMGFRATELCCLACGYAGERGEFEGEEGGRGGRRWIRRN